MASDEQLIRALGQLECATVEQISKVLRDDQNSVRQKLQRLRRDEVVIVARRVRIGSRTQCFYALAPKPVAAPTFEGGHLTAAQIKEFRESVAKTPWAAMAGLI